MSFVVIGTLFAAIAGGLFDLERLLLAVRVRDLPALSADCRTGLGHLAQCPGRVALLTVAVAAGLVLSVQSVRSQRTQGLVVAAGPGGTRPRG